MKKNNVKIKRVNRKRRRAIVVSKKMAKTAIVEIEYLIKHPYYQKRYKKHRRLAVLDDKDESQKGDRVEIEECRPISRTKRWKIIEILEH